MIDPNSELRVHSQILSLFPCSLLWYFCRAHDTNGTGSIELSLGDLTLLRQSKSTIYRWLAEGKRLGFFRDYSWKNNILSVFMGGLFPTCEGSGLDSWGAAATIPLELLLQPNGRRIIATGINTQDLQHRSRYAATHPTTKRDSVHKLPTVDDIFGLQDKSDEILLKTDRGASLIASIPGVEKVTSRQVVTNELFVPFGASQDRISESLNQHPSTSRRHLTQLGIPKRQLVQTKPEYSDVLTYFEGGSNHCFFGNPDNGFSGDIGFIRVDDSHLRLFERNGNTRSRKQGGHSVRSQRFYQASDGRVFIYRCNLYQIDFKLDSMRKLRQKWKKRTKMAKMGLNACTVNLLNSDLPDLEILKKPDLSE
jgi:hypothetical protein